MFQEQIWIFFVSLFFKRVVPGDKHNIYKSAGLKISVHRIDCFSSNNSVEVFYFSCII